MPDTMLMKKGFLESKETVQKKGMLLKEECIEEWQP
jgi:hypothetical protein